MRNLYSGGRSWQLTFLQFLLFCSALVPFDGPIDSIAIYKLIEFAEVHKNSVSQELRTFDQIVDDIQGGFSLHLQAVDLDVVTSAAERTPAAEIALWTLSVEKGLEGGVKLSDVQRDVTELTAKSFYEDYFLGWNAFVDPWIKAAADQAYQNRSQDVPMHEKSVDVANSLATLAIDAASRARDHLERFLSKDTVTNLGDLRILTQKKIADLSHFSVAEFALQVDTVTAIRQMGEMLSDWSANIRKVLLKVCGPFATSMFLREPCLKALDLEQLARTHALLLKTDDEAALKEGLWQIGTDEHRIRRELQPQTPEAAFRLVQLHQTTGPLLLTDAISQALRTGSLKDTQRLVSYENSHAKRIFEETGTGTGADQEESSEATILDLSGLQENQETFEPKLAEDLGSQLEEERGAGEKIAQGKEVMGINRGTSESGNMDLGKLDLKNLRLEPSPKVPQMHPPSLNLPHLKSVKLHVPDLADLHRPDFSLPEINTGSWKPEWPDIKSPKIRLPSPGAFKSGLGRVDDIPFPRKIPLNDVDMKGLGQRGLNAMSSAGQKLGVDAAKGLQSAKLAGMVAQREGVAALGIADRVGKDSGKLAREETAELGKSLGLGFESGVKTAQSVGEGGRSVYSGLKSAGHEISKMRPPDLNGIGLAISKGAEKLQGVGQNVGRDMSSLSQTMNNQGQTLMKELQPDAVAMQEMARSVAKSGWATASAVPEELSKIGSGVREKGGGLGERLGHGISGALATAGSGLREVGAGAAILGVAGVQLMEQLQHAVKGPWPFHPPHLDIPNVAAMMAGVATHAAAGMRGAAEAVKSGLPHFFSPAVMALSKATGLLMLGILPPTSYSTDASQYQRRTQSPFIHFAFKKVKDVKELSTRVLDNVTALWKDRVKELDAAINATQERRKWLYTNCTKLGAVAGQSVEKMRDSGAKGPSGFGKNTIGQELVEKSFDMVPASLVMDFYPEATMIGADLESVQTPYVPQLNGLGKRSFKTVRLPLIYDKDPGLWAGKTPGQFRSDLYGGALGNAKLKLYKSLRPFSLESEI